MDPIKSTQKKITNFLTGSLATRIVAVSESVRDEWSKNRGIPFKKMIVIYNCPGFDFSNIPHKIRHLDPSSPIRLVCIGALSPMKGHIYAIEAMKTIISKFKNCILSIYGRDYEGYKPVLVQAIKKFGVEDHVNLAGTVESVYNILMSHDILITPSLAEGFGMINIEALGVGLPVIASDIPAHREVLMDGKYGVLAASKDANAIASAIIDIASNSRLYEELSRKGPERAVEFSGDHMIDSYYKLYTSLVETADKTPEKNEPEE